MVGGQAGRPRLSAAPAFAFIDRSGRRPRSDPPGRRPPRRRGDRRRLSAAPAFASITEPAADRVVGGRRVARLPAGPDAGTPVATVPPIPHVGTRLAEEREPPSAGQAGTPVATRLTGETPAVTMGAMREAVTRRNLPHWYRPGAAHFVTYRLAGSLPAAAAARIRGRLDRDLAGVPPDDFDRRAAAHKRAFAAYDRALHAAPGVRHLENPEIAGVVAGSLRRLDGSRYVLLAYCVMPNHVHAVFVPTAADLPDRVEDVTEAPPTGPLTPIMQALKGYTAHAANRILGRTGRFWSGGILRPLGAGRRGTRPGRGIRRSQPGHRGFGEGAGGLAVDVAEQRAADLNSWRQASPPVRPRGVDAAERSRAPTARSAAGSGPERERRGG